MGFLGFRVPGLGLREFGAQGRLIFGACFAITFSYAFLGDRFGRFRLTLAENLPALLPQGQGQFNPFERTGFQHIWSSLVLGKSGHVDRFAVVSKFGVACVDGIPRCVRNANLTTTNLKTPSWPLKPRKFGTLTYIISPAVQVSGLCGLGVWSLEFIVCGV